MKFYSSNNIFVLTKLVWKRICMKKIKTYCHVKTTTTVKFSHTLAQERANTDSGPENISSLAHAQEKDEHSWRV